MTFESTATKTRRILTCVRSWHFGYLYERACCVDDHVLESEEMVGLGSCLTLQRGTIRHFCQNRLLFDECAEHLEQGPNQSHWRLQKESQKKRNSRNTHPMLELLMPSTFLQIHPDNRKLWTRPPQVRKHLWVFQPEGKPARTCCGNVHVIYVRSLNGIARMFHTVQHCKYPKRPVG